MRVDIATASEYLSITSSIAKASGDKIDVSSELDFVFLGSLNNFFECFCSELSRCLDSGQAGLAREDVVCFVLDLNVPFAAEETIRVRMASFVVL